MIIKLKNVIKYIVLCYFISLAIVSTLFLIISGDIKILESLGGFLILISLDQFFFSFFNIYYVAILITFLISFRYIFKVKERSKKIILFQVWFFLWHMYGILLSFVADGGSII